MLAKVPAAAADRIWPAVGMLTLILGPMFTEKTEALHSWAKKKAYAGYAVLIIKWSDDARYADVDTSASKGGSQLTSSPATDEMAAITVIHTKDLSKVDQKVIDVHPAIAIDEGQFHREHLTDCAVRWTEAKHLLAVAALNGTSGKAVFPGDPIGQLMPHVDEIDLRRTVCSNCRRHPAIFTMTTVPRREVICVGSKKDGWAPACRLCHPVRSNLNGIVESNTPAKPAPMAVATSVHQYHTVAKSFLQHLQIAFVALKQTKLVANRDASAEAIASFETILNGALAATDDQKMVVAAMRCLAMGDKAPLHHYLVDSGRQGIALAIDGPMVERMLGTNGDLGLVMDVDGRFRVGIDPQCGFTLVKRSGGGSDKRSGGDKRGGRGGGGSGRGRGDGGRGRGGRAERRGRTERSGDGADSARDKRGSHGDKRPSKHMDISDYVKVYQTLAEIQSPPASTPYKDALVNQAALKLASTPKSPVAAPKSPVSTAATTAITTTAPATTAAAVPAAIIIPTEMSHIGLAPTSAKPVKATPAAVPAKAATVPAKAAAAKAAAAAPPAKAVVAPIPAKAAAAAPAKAAVAPAKAVVAPAKAVVAPTPAKPAPAKAVAASPAKAAAAPAKAVAAPAVAAAAPAKAATVASTPPNPPNLNPKTAEQIQHLLAKTKSKKTPWADVSDSES